MHYLWVAKSPNIDSLLKWLTWSELTSSPRITKEEFQGQLAKYSKSSTLIACTKLSVGFGYGPDACTVPTDHVIALHIPIVFPPALVPLVTGWFHQEGRLPFFNGQLRYLAAETVRLQPPNPVSEIPEHGPENNEFGEWQLRSKTNYVFPRPDGRVERKFLDRCKRYARAASLNCGTCKTCVKHQECGNFYLHKFRVPSQRGRCGAAWT